MVDLRYAYLRQTKVSRQGVITIFEHLGYLDKKVVGLPCVLSNWSSLPQAGDQLFLLMCIIKH
jgi:hypothetical protein